MNVKDGRIAMRVWHFQCPECGVGDVEFGHLLTGDEIFCEACLHDETAPQTVRLWRWHADKPGAAARKATFVFAGTVLPGKPRTGTRG